MGETNSTKRYANNYGSASIIVDLGHDQQKAQSKAPRPTMSALPKRDISPAARRISMESYDPCIVKVPKG